MTKKMLLLCGDGTGKYETIVPYQALFLLRM